MKNIKTLSNDYTKNSGWILTENTIDLFQKKFYVSPGVPLRACGCGAKIDLDQIIYPTLEFLNSKYNNLTTNDLVKRRDCYFIKKKVKSITRKVFSSDLISFEQEIVDLCRNKKIDVMIELYSSAFNLYREFDQLKKQFQDVQEAKISALTNIKHEMSKENIDFNLNVAKGHSIQGEVDFIMMDFFEFGETSEGNILINNDTIITGDSVLEPHSLISIFIAFNNSLNDLLIYGGYNNIWEKDGFIFSLDDKYPRYHQFYLGFDVDLPKLNPKNPFLKTICSVFNIFKIPSPALEIDTQGQIKFHILR